VPASSSSLPPTSFLYPIPPVFDEEQLHDIFDDEGSRDGREPGLEEEKGEKEMKWEKDFTPREEEVHPPEPASTLL